MGKWIRRIGMAVLIPVLVILALSFLLYIPTFQDYAVRQATHYASQATGMRIGIAQIRLAFPLDLTVKGVEVVNPPADTLLGLRSLTVRIGALPLLRKEVRVETVDLRDATIDSGELLEGMAIKGSIGRFRLRADRIDLADEQARLNHALLSDAAITLLLNDSTTESSPPSSPVNWQLALSRMSLERVAFALQMPSESLRMSTYIEKSELKGGAVDLGTERYAARQFTLRQATFSYDGDDESPAEGLDPAHLRLADLNASLDSIQYHGRTINARVAELSANERSGLSLTSLTGRITSDKERILLPELLLRTPHSEMRLTADIPWNALDEKPTDELSARFNASIGKEDVWLVAGELPRAFKKAYPQAPFRVDADVVGNLAAMRLSHGEAVLPGAFQLTASGSVESVVDSLRRSGELQLDMRSGNLGFLLGLLPAAERDRFALPADMRLIGEATLANQEYRTALVLTEGQGKADLTARYHAGRETYDVSLRVDSLEPTHFMPYDSLYWLTASAQLSGQGTDPFAERTSATVKGRIADIRYGSSSVSDVTLEGSLEKHRLRMDLRSAYPLAKLAVNLDATLRRKAVRGTLVADVEHIDLQGLHLTTDPLSSAFQLFAEAESDLDEYNLLDVTLGNWELVTPRSRFTPKTLTLHARTDSDTTRVSFHAGDLGITLTGDDCIHDLSERLTALSQDVALQLERDSLVDLASLRPLLPELSLDVTVGKDNPIANFLQTYYIGFDRFALSASTSPEQGLSMDAALYRLARDTMQIDTIRALMRQDSAGLNYQARVVKNRYLRQPPFSAGLEGRFRHGSADARLYMKDGNGKTGLLLGIQADKLAEGVRFHLFPENPILAFRPFKLNADNYITIRNLKDIAADLRLSGERNASLWIHSEAAGEEPDAVHAELSQIDLGVIAEAFAYLPPMRGMLNADFQYAPSDSAFMVVADANIDELYYDNDRVGELLFNAVYLPLAKGNHQVDMHLFRDRKEVGAATALYQVGELDDNITGTVNLLHFPLDIANPFIPLDMAELRGDMDGSITISGTASRPRAEGYLLLDSASVYVAAAGSSFRFDDKRIEVKENQLLFDRFSIYAYNKNPFLIDGSVDFNDPNKMTADLRLTANDLQLLNAKRTEESLVYGRLFANMNATVRGPLDALIMRGDLQLLGGTNITYVLKDSPLTVQDRLSGLVSFTSFADSARSRIPRKPPLPMGGMDMLMTIRIDQAVQANVDLSADRSNHINLEGGGDLSFQYTPQGDMILNGRYTLSGGTIKYAIPVIPLKEFNVVEGSYVQWTGDPMAPTLSLAATERVRTSVTPTGQSAPRQVNFDVGIQLTQRLENLGLQFTLEAPEDMTMQEELTSKGPEERAKLAVSMLVTGMYLGGNGSGKVNLNMGDALSSFLQSEINSIAGNSLRSVDISFGMETYENGEAGGNRTDYSFRFAKRFYNDRIRIVLGGRISTGENINNGQAQPFIDNISVEYRLDNSGTRYVKIFHDKNYVSLLEGEITETGAGVVLRKKMHRLRELFNFKKAKVKPVAEER